MDKSVHFIGIAGHTMAPLAKMFKDMGWHVTGSDQKAVYPPITTYLKENKIDFFRGYNEKNLVGKPDLVIVGRSALLVDRQNPELAKTKRLNLRILSYPEALREFLIKENSIVTAGTYGKTTNAALISWILQEAGLNPSFMIGGLPLNFPDGIRKTNSSYSVVEGDETPAMNEDDLPKFMFYKPKFVLLAAAKWDHPEVFKTEKSYLSAFKKFVELIPEDGLLAACREGEGTKEVASVARCKVIWYPTKTFPFQTSLLGKHNLQNINGCITLCSLLGVKKEVIQKAVKSFKGVRGRLENLGTFGGVTVFLDFAQHPAKTKESLVALRTKYPKNKIFCIFDPHASLLQQRESLVWYPGSFDQVNQVIVTRVSFPRGVPKTAWVKGPDIVKAIKHPNGGAFYEPAEEKVVDFLKRETKTGDVAILLSSGGLKTTQMLEKLIFSLKEK